MDINSCRQESLVFVEAASMYKPVATVSIQMLCHVHRLMCPSSCCYVSFKVSIQTLFCVMLLVLVLELNVTKSYCNPIFGKVLISI